MISLLIVGQDNDNAGWSYTAR